jgi:Ca2+-binding RTX toxin-like protein
MSPVTNDWIAGQFGDDILHGGAGDDVLYGEDVGFGERGRRPSARG